MLCETCQSIFDASDLPTGDGYESPTEDDDQELFDNGPNAGSAPEDDPDAPRLQSDVHHNNIRSLRDAIIQKCSICFPLWQEVRAHTKLDLLTYSSAGIYTYYSLMDGTHEEAAVLSPGPVEYLLEIEVYNDKKRQLHRKIFILTPIEDLGHLINTQPIGERTDSASSWSLATKWLTSCVAHHAKCSQSSSEMFYPTRLLEVVGLAEKTQLKVIYARKASVTEPYMTLSHCWGSADFVKLTEATHDYLTTGFRISILPNTFRDAVIAAQRLGLPYVWIDSLCILQDSREDWCREASAMKDVYKNAMCNIAATGSADSKGGCFRNRNIDLVQPCILEKGPFKQRGRFVLEHLGFWDTDLGAAPLNVRAWVMQERLLSRRILHFGKEQLFWECCELDACETYPAGVPYQFLERANAATKLGLGIKNTGPNHNPEDYLISLEKTYWTWADIVTAYRRCNLTKAEDKLIAFSGIAKEVQSLLGGDTYLAGLWRSDLASELLWRVESCEKADGSPSSRPSTYRAPSWSWAAVDGAGPGAVFGLNFTLVTMLEAQVTPATDDYTGQIASGFLRLRGCLIKTMPFEIRPTSKALITTSETSEGFRNEFLVAPDVRVDSLDLELYCLPIHGSFTHGQFTLGGLVVRRAGSANVEYERFGTFWGWGKSRWAAPSNLPSTVAELLRGFGTTLGRHPGGVLKGHYGNEELMKVISDRFEGIEEKLFNELCRTFDHQEGFMPGTNHSQDAENGRIIVLI